jgi:hypothetical protein
LSVRTHIAALPAIITVGVDIGTLPFTQGLTARTRANTILASLAHSAGVATVPAVIHVFGGICTGMVAA